MGPTSRRQRAAAAPLSEAVRPRGATADAAGANGAVAASRVSATTALAGGLGVLLLVAALVLPSGDRAGAVPSGALVPVTAAGTSPSAEATDAISWSRAAPGAAATRTGVKTGPSPSDGVSSASVTGHDLDTATREEAARAKRAAAAKARRAAARRAARASANRRSRHRARAPKRAAGSSSTASAPAPAAAPARGPSTAPVAPAPAAPAHRAPAHSRGSASAEFGGLN